MTKSKSPLFFLNSNKLLLACFSLITGIYWANNAYNFIVPIAFFCTIISLMFLVAPKQLKNNIYLIALPIIFCIGIFRMHSTLLEHYNFLEKTKNKRYDIVATVKDIQEKSNKTHRVYITLQVYKKKKSDSKHWRSLKKNIKIYSKIIPNIYVGDTIKIKNIIFKYSKNNSFNTYLIKENIAATIFVHTLNYTLLKRPSYSLKRWLHTKKQATTKALKNKLSPIAFSLFSSIFLGNKNTCKSTQGTLKNQFKFWGILHFLARSGLHLLLFLFICQVILQCIPIYFIIKQGLLILIIIIYYLLSWPSISFIRALIAFIALKTYPFLNAKPDPVYILTYICFMVALYNPMQIFFLDFQLSFGLTFALTYFYNENIKRRQKAKLFTKKNQ